MNSDIEYKVTIRNDSGYAARMYSVCATAPLVEGRGIQNSNISRTICFATRSGVANAGQDDFSFKETYYAFIGQNEHGRIAARFFHPVRLGDNSNNGDVIDAELHLPATLTLAPSRHSPPSSKAGTFSICCTSSIRPGHNVFVGLGQFFNGEPVVTAAVPYHAGAEYQFAPQSGVSIALHSGYPGQIVQPSFDNYSYAIHFRGLDTELSVHEQSNGVFWDDKSGGPGSPGSPGSIEHLPQHFQQLGLRQGSSTFPRYTPPTNTSAPAVLPPPQPPQQHDEEEEEEEEESGGAQANGDAEESVYDELRDFDTVFLIDDSGSMRGGSWLEVTDVLKQIAPICTSFDEDGIDIFFLNYDSGKPGTKGRPRGGWLHVKDEDEVMWIFKKVKPRGKTPTGERLRDILKPYLDRWEESLEEDDEAKPLNIIIITDGKADNSKDVVNAIKEAAIRLDNKEADPWQVGLQFFQVGTDATAREWLIELDDSIGNRTGEIQFRDMVDTVVGRKTESGEILKVELTPDTILQVVIGGINRRLDGKSLR